MTLVAAAGTIKVGLLDDHPMVREGLSQLVGSISEAQLVFTAATSEEACGYLRDQSTDVLLLDVSLGDEGGLSSIEQILEIAPRLRILMLTASENESFVLEAIALGACGYLSKECSRNQIACAINAAHQGMSVIAPKKLLSGIFQGWPANTEPAECAAPLLTERELEVLRLVAQGDSNREIAEKLFLAESTVKKYSHHAMGKLGVPNRGAATIRAIRLGLIDMVDAD